MKAAKNFFYQVTKIKALVTGAGGFVGKHLVKFLRKNGIEVFTISNAVAPFSAATQSIKDNKPDYIFHLAGTTSNKNILEATQINVEYASTILNSLVDAKIASSTKVLFMGSAAEYGPQKNDLAVRENSICHPTTIYGQTKLAQTELALEWNRKNNGQVCIVRPFTILGTGMPTHLAIGSFFTQLCELKNSKAAGKILITGNLQTFRDFIDIDDAVSILWGLMQKDKKANPVYNLCSNQAISINSIVQHLISLFKIDVQVQQSQDRMRTNDIPIFFGDNNKLISQIGPYSFISWQESLRKMVEVYESK